MLIIFIGLTWTSTLSYCWSDVDLWPNLIELCDIPDAESEKEEQKSEKDGDDKIRSFHSKKELLTTNLLSKNFLSKHGQSLHHPDIITPPPEQNC